MFKIKLYVKGDDILGTIYIVKETMVAACNKR